MNKLTKAIVLALCMASTVAVAASNEQKPQQQQEKKKGKQNKAPKYTLEQAMSDKAQLNTIAFGGLAFITGDFGYDTFLPPGKVSDYFGFQYMRDIDAAEKGHNTWFLTNIANHMLEVLNEEQTDQLIELAKRQEANTERFAMMRFPLIDAFRRNLEGDLPTASNGLNKQAVINYSADLYELDGLLAYERAQVMGSVIQSLTDEQRASLNKLKFGDSATWPEIEEKQKKLKLPKTQNVAVMTYLSEMFAWYAGSLYADVYFCPERHGMYFGGFGMKTAPAMGKKNYGISTSLTGDSGEAFLATLSDTQRVHVTELIELQQEELAEIVEVRRSISSELRHFQVGESVDKQKILDWSRRYGELDGEMSYLYASAFGKVGQSLTEEQMTSLKSFRQDDPSAPTGPFIYSQPVKALPEINSDFLFEL